MSTTNAQYKITEALPASAFSIKFLTTPDEAKEAFDLHTQVRLALPEEKKGFLQPKDLSYFENLASQKTGVLVGAYTPNDVLIGSVAIVECPDLSAAVDETIITSPKGKLLSAKYKQGPIAIVQALCVREGWRGEKVADALLDEVFSWAQINRCANIFAQIAQANETSESLFGRHGYKSVDEWTAKKEHPRYLMHHAL